MTTATFALTPAAFARIGQGRLEPEDVTALRHAQLIRHWLLIRTVTDHVRERQEQYRTAGQEYLRAFAAVDQLRQTHPAAAVAVIGYPHVGAWAHALVRDLASLTADPTIGDFELLAGQLAQLGSIEAAIALRSRQDFVGRCQVRRGRIHLPGLGALQTNQPDLLVGTAAVTIKARTVTSDALDQPLRLPDDLRQAAPGWRPLFGLQATATDSDGQQHTLDVRFDDSDPYAGDVRSGQQLTLDAAEAERWQTVIREAWDLLVAHHGHFGVTIGGLLQTLVPLVMGEDRASTTLQDAMGSVSLSRPLTPVEAADILIHELAGHSVLNIALTQYPLAYVSLAVIAKCYAPWRDDARPLDGFLQGIYAFLVVLRFWTEHIMAAEGVTLRQAYYTYYRWFEPLRLSLERFSAEILTEHGRHFMAHIAAGLDSLALPDQSTVGREAAAQGITDLEAIIQAAALDAADHWLSWPLRNQVPRVGATSALELIVAAWRQGRPCPSLQPELVGGGQAQRRENQARAELLQWRAVNPDLFELAVADGLEAVAARVPGSTLADIAFAQRNYATARDGYRAAIRQFPLQVQAWVGLALAYEQLGEPQLRDHLTSTFFVYLQLLSGGGSHDLPEPAALAAWLAQASATLSEA